MGHQKLKVLSMGHAGFLVFMFLVEFSDAYICTHEIYCRGRLLHAVQMKALFPDSKTFVDMKLKMPWHEIMYNFNKLVNETGYDIPKATMEHFIKDNFDPVGSEFEKWNPPDWNQSPLFLKKIRDQRLWDFGKKLNGIWKFLGRRITDLVRENQELYSIIFVPYGMIVPGGRFREIYYWDSYWIIRGLLKSEMFYTARGIIANFVYMVRQYGLVPNGGRIYYTGRSQPPLLLPMVKSYMDATNDVDFLREHFDTLEKEYAFWLANRTVTVSKGNKDYRLARFYDDSQGPRPESYREDMHTGSVYGTEKEKNDFYSELKAAAESGLDFTSRWFIEAGTNKGDLSKTKTRSIIPVDLNAMLYWNANILSQFSKEMGLTKKSSKYSHDAKQWLEAVDKVLWHDDLGIWLDYDISNKKRREYFYATNFAPLWTGCFFKDRIEETTDKVIHYLENQKVLNFPGGIPTSFEETGQQWDFPNAWPPHQDIMISGLEATDDPKAMRIAREWALRWVYNNYRGWVETKAMHEKYNATMFGAPGTGGEYESQMGFGWTNGLILDLMDRYAEQLVAEDEPDDGIAHKPELGFSYKLYLLLFTLSRSMDKI